MRKITSIVGLLLGLVLAFPCCLPICDWIWPHATDRNRGGPGFFLILVLAPPFMNVGGIAGAIAGRRFSKPR